MELVFLRNKSDLFMRHLPRRMGTGTVALPITINRISVRFTPVKPLWMVKTSGRSLCIEYRLYKQEEGGVPLNVVQSEIFNVYPNEYHKGRPNEVVCKLYPQVAAGASASVCLNRIIPIMRTADSCVILFT